eukprot:m51a1_g14385 hypothetical protein (118) ;mRNA; f:309774-310127
METERPKDQTRERVIWVLCPGANDVEVTVGDKVLSGCGSDLKRRIKEQLRIPYFEGDFFLDLPADPKLGAFFATGTRALNPKMRLGTVFFVLLGDGSIEVRVRPGAVPHAAQQPGWP